MAMQITSETIIENIDQHFKINAGPGAGKTHWLINHIKNVLHNSTVLGKNKKIACITYTNNAVETILSRLGRCADKIEISTIHSFLYNNVIKPYVRFIAMDYDLNVKDIDGHDDIEISAKWIKSWIENHPDKSKFKHPYSVNQLTILPDNLQRIKNWLSSVYYSIDPEGEITICTDRKRARNFDNNIAINKQTLDLLEPFIINLKKEYWKKGLLSHDDVLFFSYQLLSKYPFIEEILSAKYPYCFIDEFQDSNPIQTRIVKMLGKRSTIGIIGDRAQSVYEFQGADVKQFDTFELPDIMNFEIKDNKRSSFEIVKLLNCIRTDLKQNEENNIRSDFLPQIVVGEKLDTYRKVKEIVNEELIVLSYSNITANTMRHKIAETPVHINYIEELKTTDSSNDRRNIIIKTINAIELAKECKYKEAIKTLEKLYLRDTCKEKKALSLLQLLLNDYCLYKDATLFEFHNYLNKYFHFPRVTKGKIKTFYEGHTYVQFALCINIPDNMSCFKTIHKAKGAEFDNVMLVLEKESDLDFLVSPDLMNNVDHRVYYVAVSRAKNRLFISVPTLSNKIKEKLNTLSFINIVHI